MLTVAELLDGASRVLEDLWPGEKVYYDVVPKGFVRPSCLVELEKLTIRPDSRTTAERTAQIKITRFRAVDDYHNTQVAVLAGELSWMLERFSRPALAVGTRYLTATECSGSYGNDYAEITVQLSWTDDRDAGQTEAEPMERLRLRTAGRTAEGEIRRRIDLCLRQSD